MLDQWRARRAAERARIAAIPCPTCRAYGRVAPYPPHHHVVTPYLPPARSVPPPPDVVWDAIVYIEGGRPPTPPAGAA